MLHKRRAKGRPGGERSKVMYTVYEPSSASDVCPNDTCSPNIDQLPKADIWSNENGLTDLATRVSPDSVDRVWETHDIAEDVTRNGREDRVCCQTSK